MINQNALLRYLLVLSCALGLAIPAYAQNSAFNFLLDDVSARAAALGGSFLTMQNDPNAIFYNPGALGTLDHRSLSVGYFKHLLDINSGYASFGTEVPGLGTIGAGVVYTNYGQFAETGPDGENLGTFSAGDIAMGVDYSAELSEGLHYGIGAKFIYSSIAGYSSTGAALDFGIHYIALPNRIILGASLMNLGTQINPYITTREQLPLDLKAGAALMPEHLPATIYIDFHRLNESQDNLIDHLRAYSIGVEFTTSPSLQLRGGYNNAERKDLQLTDSADLAGFSLGLGINTSIYRFDYAFNSLGKIGALHRISLGLNI